MHRIIGATFIFLSCIGFGMSKIRELRGHLYALESIQKIMCLIRNELMYMKTPFAEIFEKIATKTEEPFQIWLYEMYKKIRKKQQGNVTEIWCNSIDFYLKETALKKDDIEDLKNVGKNLESVENINLFIEQLEYKISVVRENNESKQKIYRSLGIMSGIFIIILLI